MAAVSLKENPINTSGNLPKIGTAEPDIELATADLSIKTLNDYIGSKGIVNIFHSIDTGTSAASIRQFNQEASKLTNKKVLCISKYLPFIMARFCIAEGIENIETLSDFRDGNFGKANNLTSILGPIPSLLARAIILLDEEGNILHTEQVYDFVEEPNYKSAVETLYNA